MKNNKFIISLLSTAALVSCGNRENVTPPVNEVDKDLYPNYVEDIDSLTYEFNEDNIVDPFWKGNVIYNESVLLTKNEETGIISGDLMFTPKKILSVRDFTLKEDVFKLNTDYTIEENRIIRTESSAIPYRSDAQLKGDEVPEGFRLVNSISNQLTDIQKFAGGTIYTESPFYYGSQIWVSYVYDIEEIDKNIENYPKYDVTKLPNLIAKLNNKEKVKVVGLGDSVLEGCSSSGKFNHEPFMDDFITMTCKQLAKSHETQVELKNLSVGGKMSSWGAQNEQIQNVIKENPDLFLLHFGINDLGANRGTMQYSDDIESIVLRVKEALPNCEILLLSPFGPNPIVYDYSKLQDYVDALKGIEETYDGVKLIDMFSLSQIMYKNKKYLDMSANGINHVNDYASRLYAETILSTISNK